MSRSLTYRTYGTAELLERAGYLDALEMPGENPSDPEDRYAADTATLRRWAEQKREYV